MQHIERRTSTTAGAEARALPESAALPTAMPTAMPAPTVHAASGAATPVAISFVIPIKDEEESLRPLYAQLTAQMEALGKTYEVIFVDDGSRDGSFRALQALHAEDPRIHIIRFRRNFGKTQALVAGFARAHGQIIFTMDADLQDDPAEIPTFLAKLDEGYDLVSGWKYPRLDPLTKTFPSRIFNGMVSRSTGVKLHDINCGFKAYRREIIEDIKLYGELHRFIPVLAHERGFEVTEVKVRHHKRKFGRSKYGARRFMRGFLDLIMVLFLRSYLRTPLRLFGMLGLVSFFLGVLIDLYIVADRYLPFGSHQDIHNRPLLFVGIMLIIFGVSFVLTGLQSEMIRHFAYRQEEEYSIRQVIE